MSKPDIMMSITFGYDDGRLHRRHRRRARASLLEVADAAEYGI